MAAFKLSPSLKFICNEKHRVADSVRRDISELLITVDIKIMSK